jgi:hypothetical protein
MYCSANVEFLFWKQKTTMPFPIGTYYEIQHAGDEPVIIKVINSTKEFKKVRVEEVDSGKMKYLYEYLTDPDVSIAHIPSLPEKKA